MVNYIQDEKPKHYDTNILIQHLFSKFKNEATIEGFVYNLVTKQYTYYQIEHNKHYYKLSLSKYQYYLSIQIVKFQNQLEIKQSKLILFIEIQEKIKELALKK